MKRLNQILTTIIPLFTLFQVKSQTSSPDLFRERIYYQENVSFNPNPQFNGNIGSLTWSIDKNLNGYQYQYDGRNQMRVANHFSQNSKGKFIANDEYTVKSIDYDFNGNITDLNRININGLDKDLLAYSYNNRGQLKSLEDLGDLNEGFTSDFNSGSYTYDGNGNMVFDGHRNCTISYNKLNLPDTIAFASGDSIVMIYDASGKKWQKHVINRNGQRSTLTYIDNFQFLEDEFSAYYFEDGRIAQNNSNYQFEYQIKDHLNNNRVFFSDLNGDEKIDPNQEVLSQVHYYPFGMEMEGHWNQQTATTENPYKYNGKEMNPEFGLNWLDYGARWYDPSIGRWNTIDPKAEEFQSWNPYNYVVNNPVILMDPDGKAPESIHKDAEGNILAVMDDGDDNVYVHNDINTCLASCSGDAGVEAFVEKYQKHGTSAGGEKQDAKLTKEEQLLIKGVAVITEELLHATGHT
ncbi:MAG: RHS repeat-associated core domain-containing protein, partial [Flavobacteriales bacterium]|nr:RHS repeat-associated core domain-containing protein [Flavobacteriales bacterium]